MILMLCWWRWFRCFGYMLHAWTCGMTECMATHNPTSQLLTTMGEESLHERVKVMNTRTSVEAYCILYNGNKWVVLFNFHRNISSQVHTCIYYIMTTQSLTRWTPWNIISLRIYQHNEKLQSAMFLVAMLHGDNIWYTYIHGNSIDDNSVAIVIHVGPL